MSQARAVVAEGMGTAMLLAAVVGSGIMAERLAQGQLAVALLCNTVATAGALYALIAAFGALSGAHFNPVVTVVAAVRGGLPWRAVGPYTAAQICGAVAGVAAANVMFGLAPFAASHHERSGAPQLFAECIATFGLIATIFLIPRDRPHAAAARVAAYITAAYWFTSSTSFANPAVTVARALSDTFTGIRPTDVPGFIVAQATGGACALLLVHFVLPARKESLP